MQYALLPGQHPGIESILGAPKLRSLSRVIGGPTEAASFLETW
jgi:hypothetical protein